MKNNRWKNLFAVLLRSAGSILNTQDWWSFMLVGIGTLTILIALWFLLTPNFIPELVFPSPHSVLLSIESKGWDVLADAKETLQRVFIGWGIGVILGVLMGLAMTWSRLFFSISNPLIEMIRPIPPIAWVPFFIIWFGLGSTSQIILISLGGFMVMAVNTFVAVNNMPAIYIRAASIFGASRFQIYKTVIIPAILPSLVSGLRIAAALAFGTAIAAEFMGAQSGLGFSIMVARRTLNTNTILLETLILGVESFILDLIIRLVTGYLCRWSDVPLEAIQEL